MSDRYLELVAEAFDLFDRAARFADMHPPTRQTISRHLREAAQAVEDLDPLDVDQRLSRFQNGLCELAESVDAKARRLIVHELRNTILLIEQIGDRAQPPGTPRVPG